MTRLVQISDNQYKQLRDIKEKLEKKTGQPISYKIAIEIYATKKPKSKITITNNKNANAYHKNTPNFSFGEINMDATLKKILK